MKKIKYLISSMFVAAIAAIALTSCGGNNETPKENNVIVPSTTTEDTKTGGVISGDTPATNAADQKDNPNGETPSEMPTTNTADINVNDTPKEEPKEEPAATEENAEETSVTEVEEVTEEVADDTALKEALEERKATYIANSNAFYESVKNNAYTRAYYDFSENSTGTKVSEIERFKLAIIKYPYTYTAEDGTTYTYTNWKLTVVPYSANKNIESDVFYVSNFEYLANADYKEEYIKLTIRAYIFRDNSNNIYDFIAVNDGLAEGKPSSLNYKLEEKTFRVPAGLYTFTQD